MRVCHLIQYFHVGGIERLVLGLGEALRPYGVETSAIAYTADGPFRDQLEAAGIATTFLPTRPGVQVRLPVRLADVLKRGAIDVLHTHHVGPFLYGAAAAALSRTGHVHTEHSRELYDRTRRRVVGWSMPLRARVVTVSGELSNYRALTFGDVPDAIPNGVAIPALATKDDHLAARAALGLPAEAYLVGCVGRLSPEKNPVGLVDAIAPLAGAHLVLVGDGAERAAVAEAVARHGVAERVHLLGVRSDVERLLPAFDVIALASHREGLPLALLEAMAAGLPVVATAVGGIPALLSAGGGLLVPAGDTRAMTAALTQYRDEALRKRDGAVARAHVIEKFSIRPMASGYLAHYRAIIGRSH